MKRARRTGGGAHARGPRLIVAVALGLAATSPALAATPTPAPSGSWLWSDDFSSASSGWNISTLPSGASFAYGDHEYLITPAPNLDDLAQAPYAPLQPQLIVSVDVSLPTGAPSDLRGGVVCGRPSALDSRYVFFVSAGGDWSILRIDPSKHGPGQEVVTGSVPHFPQGASIPLMALCSDHGSASNGTTTDLSFFVNGNRVAHVADTWSGVPGAGWRSALDAGPGTDAPTAVSFRNFALQDASFGTSKAVPSTGQRYISRLLPRVLVACALGGPIAIGLVIARRRRRGAFAPAALPQAPAPWGTPPGPPTGRPPVPPPPPPQPDHSPVPRNPM